MMISHKVLAVLFFSVLFTFFFQSSNLNAQNDFITINQLDFPSTISSQSVNCVLQVPNGYLLIGTDNDLLKYDGHEISTVLQNNNIRHLAIDKTNTIWVGTINGLFSLNMESATLKKVDEIGNQSIRALHLSKKGELLIGTENGLLIYNLKDKLINKYVHHQNFNEGISHNIVRSIFEDKMGNLWIGTENKLNKFNRAKNTFTHYNLQPSDIPTPQNNLVLTIKSTTYKNEPLLLIGTETGLCLFNPKTEKWKTLTTNSTKGKLSNNVIKKIAITENHKIWLGTDYGLNLFDINTKTFTSFFHEFGKINTINGNTIQTLFLDNQHNLWIGNQGGLNSIYNSANTITFNKIDRNGPQLPGGIGVNAMSEDAKGNYWIASDIGLIQYITATKKYVYFSPPEILHRRVFDVYADLKGMVWIATSGGLNTYNIYTEKIKRYIAKPQEKDQLHTNYLSKVTGNSKGDIWIGTVNKGIYKVVQNNGELSFINFRHEEGNPDSLPEDGINTMIFDQNNNLWVSTYTKLATFNAVKGCFINIDKFRKEQDLTEIGNIVTLFSDEKAVFFTATNKIYKKPLDSNYYSLCDSMAIDMKSMVVVNDKLWFSDTRNLYSYDLKKKNVLKVPTKEIVRVKFKANTYLDSKGKVFFFGKEGFVSLDPNKISSSIKDKPVVFTDLKINEKSLLNTVDNGKFNRDLNTIESLDLAYDENNFEFSFSSMNLSIADPTEYMFQLEGFDDKWQILNDRNSVAYKNLRPKKYTLKVKASNDNGVFPKEYREIAITVAAPFWATNWALLVYFLLIIGFLMLVKKILTEKLHYTNDIKLEKIKLEKSEELIEIKTKFYNNITHDLKTPLSLILGPTEQLMASETDEQKLNTLKIIKRNTNKLQLQVNKILDLRKIEKGVEKLRIQQYDIVKFSQRILSQFKEETINRDITLNFTTTIPTLVMWFDIEKLENVYYNLLSNAYKFTPDKGEINLSISYDENSPNEEYIKIALTDTGEGIPKDKIQQVFERFNAVEGKNYTNQKGSGIGLSIVNQYVALHSGTIQVKSEVSKGSTFTLCLPINKETLSDYVESDLKQIEEAELNVEKKPLSPELITEQNTDLPIILIVEDDIDMREFLSGSFKNQYKVFLAENGKEGWNIAIQEVPDIIISDVMMPIMDGFELCQKVKENVTTSHIPFILLTAKSSSACKLMGTEFGADDYIEKPFHLEYLTTKTGQLLNQRNLLKKTYLQEVILEPKEIAVQSVDDKFLVQVMKMIEDNIDNPDLNVKMLSTDLSMSHSNFYRKIKGLTGQTATDLIRTIRLKRAAQLLDANVYRVKDVMYQSGFTHSSYFTRSFKAMYGVTPKEYMLTKKKLEVTLEE
ncbi:response regulator [Flammeovirga pectinis]|uniref:histidine kinase n=1 Tax=Flammeovirga pectinis TaxID=2494373 RepID=A0A3Q9FSA5_9BACT|nr:hybrid sensor histidine kinase/response regulator transcription factor [Flammeovirga pectinis]AZQ64770.1 response regulator [Flammeovirga pectinis]